MQARWKATLNAAKQEALLAADLYNQTRSPRRLEAFFVHMHLAWLYLFIATYQRKRQPYFYRRSDGRHYEKVNGERKTWDLDSFVATYWEEQDPIRKNLELSIALRNKIEHRHEEATALATAGYAQALLLNLESFLVQEFGSHESLSDALRFPVFVGTFSRDSAVRLADLQRKMPSSTHRLLTEFELSLNPSVREDARYEFRVHIVPKLSSKTEADTAITFVRAEDLTTEQREALEAMGKTGSVIVRERVRNVANAHFMTPTEAAKAIEQGIPFKFGVHPHFVKAWKALDARPSARSIHPEHTREEWCLYDRVHRDYVYTADFVAKVVRECGTDSGFQGLLGMRPVRKGPGE